MPRLLCPNGHEYHYRNTRGSRSAGRACPTCGEPLRAPTAYRCNKLGLYDYDYTSPDWTTTPGVVTTHRARGRCSEPKGHDGPHKAFGWPFVEAST